MLARPVIAFGDGALEFEILDRVVFRRDGETANLGIERWAFPDRPGFQNAADLESKVEVQGRCVVLLANELVFIDARNFAFWFGRSREVSFLPVNFQTHLY
jgi:hypothetical protein